MTIAAVGVVVVIILLTLGNTVRENGAVPAIQNQKVVPWPPEEVVIPDTADKMALTSISSIQRFSADGDKISDHVDAEIVDLQNSLMRSVPPGETFSQDQRKQLDTMNEKTKSELKTDFEQLETQYIKDGRAMLISPGKYKIIGFFDSKSGGKMELSPTQRPAEDSAWVEIVYKNQEVYYDMDLFKPWLEHRTRNQPSSDGQTQDDTVAPVSASPVLTKEQWKAAVPQNGMLVGFGRIACDKAALFSAVGPPSRTEAAGDDEDLYWDCSDGTMEVVCARGQYELGMVGGSVNEY